MKPWGSSLAPGPEPSGPDETDTLRTRAIFLGFCLGGDSRSIGSLETKTGKREWARGIGERGG